MDTTLHGADNKTGKKNIMRIGDENRPLAFQPPKSDAVSTRQKEPVAPGDSLRPHTSRMSRTFRESPPLKPIAPAQEFDHSEWQHGSLPSENSSLSHFSRMARPVLKAQALIKVTFRNVGAAPLHQIVRERPEWPEGKGPETETGPRRWSSEENASLSVSVETSARA
jgi:hypothetical protein